MVFSVLTDPLQSPISSLLHQLPQPDCLLTEGEALPQAPLLPQSWMNDGYSKAYCMAEVVAETCEGS